MLQPEAIAYIVEEAAKIIERELKKNPERPHELEAEARKLRRELERFMQLIAEGNAPDAVLAEIGRREERSKEIERDRKALVVAPQVWTSAEIRAMCGERIRRFSALRHDNVPVANQAIGKLSVKPSEFFPVTTAEGHRTLGFEAVTKLGPLFDRAHKGLASPGGNADTLLELPWEWKVAA